MEKSQVAASAAKTTEPKVAAEAPATTKKSAIALANSQKNMVGFKAKDVEDVLNAYKGQITSVLPDVLTPERMIAMAATEVTKNPAILKCTPASIVGAVLQASVLGFQPVSALGYCYFVPYKDQVQFQIGYKGMLALARRSGEVSSVYAEVVREGDEFEYTLGLHRNLIHKPSGDISKPITHAYSVVIFKNGDYNFEVLSREAIERLRKRSPSQKDSPTGAWLTDYDAMAKAKALKQLAKYLPLSIDVHNAISTDGGIINATAFDAKGNLREEDVEYVELDENTGEIIEPATDNK